MQITQAVAKSIRRELITATARNESELDSAFALLAERRPDGVVIPTNAFFLSARKRIVALAADCKLAAVYDARDFVEAGGLISYGQSTERFRQVGVYVGKICTGDARRPAGRAAIKVRACRQSQSYKSAKS